MNLFLTKGLGEIIEYIAAGIENLQTIKRLQ